MYHCITLLKEKIIFFLTIFVLSCYNHCIVVLKVCMLPEKFKVIVYTMVLTSPWSQSHLVKFTLSMVTCSSSLMLGEDSQSFETRVSPPSPPAVLPCPLLPIAMAKLVKSSSSSNSSFISKIGEYDQDSCDLFFMFNKQIRTFTGVLIGFYSS